MNRSQVAKAAYYFPLILYNLAGIIVLCFLGFASRFGAPSLTDSFHKWKRGNHLSPVSGIVILIKGLVLRPGLF